VQLDLTGVQLDLTRVQLDPYPGCPITRKINNMYTVSRPLGLYLVQATSKSINSHYIWQLYERQVGKRRETPNQCASENIA